MTDLPPPPPPPPLPGQGRRSGCWRWGTIGCGGLAVLVVGAMIALIVIDRRLNPQVDAPPLVADEIPRGAPLLPGSIVYDTDSSGTFEIWVLPPEGGDPVQLTDDPAYDSWWGRPSPDGRTVLFYRTPAGTHDRDFTKTSLWTIGADGGAPVELLPVGAHGWNLQGHAEWSPDGDQLVMFGGKRTNPHIFVTDRLGRDPVDLADDGGSNLDPSWSPDGSAIVYVGCPGRICLPSDQELYVVDASGGDRRRLTEDGVRDHDPYFSPDGRSIAFLSQTGRPDDAHPLGTWDIRTVAPDGGDVRQVTDDGNVNSMPKWLDDARIVFHRFVYGRSRGYDLAAVDLTTGMVSELLVTSSVEEYPAPVR